MRLLHAPLMLARVSRNEGVRAPGRCTARQLRTERTGAAARGATHIVQKRLRETTFGAS